MSGAGFARAGFYPAGFGSAEQTPELRETYAAISRRVDPTTGDYSRGFYSTSPGFDAMPIVLAKVMTRLGNKVGSFAWNASLGDPSLTIPKDNGKLFETVNAYTRAQLADLVDAKEIEILSVTVASDTGAYGRVVIFRDSSTDREVSTGQVGFP